MVKIPLIDLVAQYNDIRDEIQKAVIETLESGDFVLGPHVAALEKEVAAYLGSAYAVGVASGTDALVLALRCLGTQPGDEVIVPAYSFYATAEAAMLLGATPVFVDVDPETYCLNVEEVAKRVTARTKAVIPVHLYGHPADMGPLLKMAADLGISIIEDNAQAIGAEYGGKKTGTLGTLACLSFFPSKNLGAYGDGGMIVTSDAGFAERIRKLRTHGWQKKYFPETVGYNSRLDELQAAILRVKLVHLDCWNRRRRTLAGLYNERLRSLDLQLPVEKCGSSHVYHLYVVRSQARESLRDFLTRNGIATGIYYPLPLHLVKACESLGYNPGDFPVSEQASRETLALPIFPELTESTVDKICGAVIDFFRSR